MDSRSRMKCMNKNPPCRVGPQLPSMPANPSGDNTVGISLSSTPKTSPVTTLVETEITTPKSTGDTKTGELTSSWLMSTTSVDTSIRTPTLQKPDASIRSEESTAALSRTAGISNELIVVSALAGLGFLCAILAVAFACHARKKNERNTRSNGKERTATYIPVEDLPGNPMTDSTAENPTYAEIGDTFLNLSSFARTSSEDGQSGVKERTESATLPLIPSQYAKDDLPSLPPRQSYEELNPAFKSKTFTDARCYSPSSATDPRGNHHYLSLIAENGQGFCPDHPTHDGMSKRHDNNNLQSKGSSDVTPTLPYTETTEHVDDGDLCEQHKYITLMQKSPSDKKGSGYVDVDYPSHDINTPVRGEDVNNAKSAVMSSDNSQDRELPAAPDKSVLYFTLEQESKNADGEDRIIPSAPPVELQLYFTLEKDSIADTEREDDTQRRPNDLDLSINDKANQKTDVSEREHSRTCGMLRLCTDAGKEKTTGDSSPYQQLPVASPTEENEGAYQRLNRGFMEKTLRK